MLSLCRTEKAEETTTDVCLTRAVEEAWDAVETDDAHLLIEADTTVTADRSHLQRVLVNLLRNTVEHSDHETTVRVGPLDDGFYIEDNGPGIPVDEREEVFDFGYTTDEDGTGYGLTIVQRIADRHGWSVEIAESEYGGARFELYENFPSSES